MIWRSERKNKGKSMVYTKANAVNWNLFASNLDNTVCIWLLLPQPETPNIWA